MQDNMLILAIETTGPYASVAITDGKECFQIAGRDNFSHLQRISPMVLEILKNQGIKPSQLSALAVSRGPGSFTGLRIGVVTAKGFAQIWNKPVIEVPTLYSFAYTKAELPENAVICPIFDARRSQVYGAALRKAGFVGAEYKGAEAEVSASAFPESMNAQGEPESLIAVPEGAYDIAEYLALLKNNTEASDNLCFFGDGIKPYRAAIEAFFEDCSGRIQFAEEAFALQEARNVAELGALLYKKGKLKDCFTAQPEYLRAAEAERKLKEKSLKG